MHGITNWRKAGSYNNILGRRWSWQDVKFERNLEHEAQSIAHSHTKYTYIELSKFLFATHNMPNSDVFYMYPINREKQPAVIRRNV